MHHDTSGELHDLVAVHGFYVSILEKALGYPVPVPELVEEALSEEGDPIPYIRLLKRWLGFLDLAIAPPMVRDALKESVEPATVESLLRYYVLKTSHVDNDRDKADFVATWLFRRFATTHRSHYEQELRQFEQHLQQILNGSSLPELPEDRLHLVNEFEYIRSEVDDFRHFDALMDSGIMQRVRGIKANLGESFYHPKSLAAVSAYNNFFGNRFDELFHKAAVEIKSYATRVQQEGGSIASRVEGDVTVKQLEEVDDRALKIEYGRAQEHFRKISSIKKAVDKRSGKVAPSTSPIAPRPMDASGAAAGAPNSPGAIARVENSRLGAAVDVIINLLRTAPDTKNGVVLPLSWGNLALSAAECDAFKAEYKQEKSFRGEFALAMTHAVALYSRLTEEYKEFRLKKSSSQFLWKPHAESLGFLVKAASEEAQNGERLLQIAHQRGLTDKASAMSATLDRLRSQVRQVSGSLAQAANS